MASPAISSPVVNNSDRSLLRRRKKKKIPNQNQNLRDQAQAAQTEWKSDTQQQAYSSKLLQALRQVRISGGGGSPKRGRAVREAADRVLAVAAKGRSRWSRAILTNRLKLKFMKKTSASHKRQRVTVTGNRRSQKKHRVTIFRLKAKSLPAFQRKARVLGRLVPGCRKQPLPIILEEATDYIAALEMQVRAMSALTQWLSGGAAASSSSSSSLPSSSSSANVLNPPGSNRQAPAS